ncbi:MAG TPA: hypothetical protein VG845_12555 [Dehalococcoidia bacterium]|jgi:hypothetical protein|nr:hypothetical protein [Dehalococcoidia bacterium]
MAHPSLIEKGRERTDEFLRHGVDVWVEEGRLDPARKEALLRSLNTPDVEAALLHTGAHFAISIPLRFPFGAMARFFYTLGLRLKAEVGGLLGRESPVHARRYHTILVMLISLLPGFGRLAYFSCPALRGERLLLVIPLDQVSRKLPFRVYRRFHLDALYTYWAYDDPPRRGFRHFIRGGWWQDLKERLGETYVYRRLIAGLLVFDLAALSVGAYIYAASDRTSHWWFDERSVMATINVGQLLLAGVCGLVAYRQFWRLRHSDDVGERAGIFLWAIGGMGLLLFAVDDFFSIHEQLGRSMEASLSVFLPVNVNMPDDLLILCYAIVGVATLYIFRMEVFANRPSATLLQLAAAAAILMVVTDIFATSIALKAVEYPAQVLANGLLALAFIVRLREVTVARAEVRAAVVPARTV